VAVIPAVRVNRRDTTAIALVGGKVAFNNGIHLGVIEAAEDPRAEAWANIQRIDDVAELIFNLARGRHVPRPSINLNYHYGAMGLSGSELRSLVLPIRAGEQAAERLLTDRLPVSPMAAQRLGLVDGVGPDDPVAFDRWARQVATQVADRPSKAPSPSVDPRPYRQRELAEMWHDIFEDRHGFEANRRRFLGLAA
jgi:putative two-component system protein, hydrogenase maturation factor HypX/HoxX